MQIFHIIPFFQFTSLQYSWLNEFVVSKFVIYASNKDEMLFKAQFNGYNVKLKTNILMKIKMGLGLIRIKAI